MAIENENMERDLAQVETLAKAKAQIVHEIEKLRTSGAVPQLAARVG